MTTNSILQWSLFRESNCQLNFREYSGIHFFNRGNSAYLIKNETLNVLHHPNVVSSARTNSVSRFATPNSNMGYPEQCKLEANGIKGISTGEEHTVVLDYDGYVYCWGSNQFGQLGAGHRGTITHPYKTNLKDIDKIACGRSFTIASSKCDELWFWGNLNLNAPGGNIEHLTPTLIELPDDTIPKFISAGDEHIAVMGKYNKVYIWGNNTFGQLGLGHRNSVRYPQHLIVDRSLVDTNSYHVLCGYQSTVYLTEEGIVGICNENTDNVVQTVCDNSFRIDTLATHWRTTFFAAADVCGFYYVLGKVNDRASLIRVAYEDISDGFIDIGTPFVLSNLTNRASSGIQRIVNSDVREPVQCANHVEVADLYNSENYSDIQIKLSDGVIYAHKLILTKQSANLKKTLTENGAEIKVLDMSNMNATAYRTYIKFLYTGIVDLHSIDYIPEVFSLAEQDNNQKLKSLCLQIWNSELKQENIVSAFHKASTSNLQLLTNACGGLLCQHFQYILNSEEYNALPVLTKLSLLTLVAMRNKK